MPGIRLYLEDGSSMMAPSGGMPSGGMPSGAEAEFTLGRGAENAVVLHSPAVSAVHARVQHLAGGWLLTDLDSTNGTLVNGHAVTAHWLQDGDVLELGGLTVRVSLTASAEGGEGA